MLLALRDGSVPWARWGWAGRDPLVLLEGPQGFVPGCCCCKSRDLGKLQGLEERAAWSWVRMRMHRLRLLSRAAVPAVNQADLSPGGGRDRDRRWL